MTPSDISIVIPVLNEARGIVKSLLALQELRLLGAELIVVDGGSDDATPELVKPLVSKLIYSQKGRARQMNAGFHASTGEVVFFLHSDTGLPAAQPFCDFLSKMDDQTAWGFFKVQLSGNDWWCQVISSFMNVRSRMTGIATGDQVLFVQRQILDLVGGFPDLPLMEDITICKRLKSLVGRGVATPLVVNTSSRRWRQKGVLRTVMLMWMLRLLYFAGVPAAKLLRLYYPEHR